MEETLRAGLEALGLSGIDTGTLCAFGAAMLEKNTVMNLTAIEDPAEVARLHFLDSLALLTLADFRGKSVVDVGCGAGFPGVPLKIGEPSMQLTLLDSLGKRVSWLDGTLRQLSVEAECVCARAEEAVSTRREQYDIATARAVARLPVLCELCLPYVRVGGCFLAMKGAAAEEEAREAYTAIKTLGGKLREVASYQIPGTDAVHRVVIIDKVAPTPARYPRRYAKIKAEPL